VLLALALALFVVLLFAAMPIAFAIGFAAWVYMLAAGVPNIIFAQQMANGPRSWVLLAMPLFVLAGLLLNTAGISARLIDFARALVGHLRGGLGMINVVASMLFGGMSGSSVADTAALGSVLIPGMRKSGYSSEVSAAITSSSASIGIIIPPSLAMILFGAITGVSVGTLFIAGILPGLLVGLTQMVVIFLLARRYGWGAVTEFSPKRLWSTGLRASLGLLMPVIILGGILGGVFTPTEAAAVAVVYGVLVSTVVYRSLSLRKLYRVLVDAGVLTAVVMIIVATSFTFGWMMAHELVPQRIAGWLAAQALSPELFLILVSLLLIVLGALLHGDPLLLITVPILFPSVLALGVDPIHFAMIAVLCVAIGQQTPPVGSTLFVVSVIAGRDIFAVSKANIPFVVTLLFVLGVILFWPELVLVLPRAFGML